jgi:hypothetical protein
VATCADVESAWRPTLRCGLKVPASRGRASGEPALWPLGRGRPPARRSFAEPFLPESGPGSGSPVRSVRVEAEAPAEAPAEAVRLQEAAAPTSPVAAAVVAAAGEVLAGQAGGPLPPALQARARQSSGPCKRARQRAPATAVAAANPQTAQPSMMHRKANRHKTDLQDFRSRDAGCRPR